MKVGSNIFKILLTLALAFFSCSKITPQFPEPEAETFGMDSWIEYLCSEECEGRLSGTAGNLKAYNYLVSELKKMGHSPETQTFEVEGKTLRNILVKVPGSIDSTIAIGAHYDGQWESKFRKHYPAANDNASGTVALLKIIQDLKSGTFSSKYSFLFCFWDGEENNFGGPLKGSKYFVKNYPDIKKVKYYTNLDGVAHKHETGFDMFYYGDVMENKVVPHVQETSGLKFAMIVKKNKGEGASDYVPFAKLNIPIFAVKTDENGGCLWTHHTIYDDPAAISYSTMKSIIDVVEDVVMFFN